MDMHTVADCATPSASSAVDIRRADCDAIVAKMDVDELLFKHEAWPLSCATYRVLRSLGQGTFSTCFLAERSSAFEAARVVALKVTPRYGDPSRVPSREIEIMLLLRGCPQVCSFIEYFFVSASHGMHNTFHHVLVLEAYDCSLHELITTKRHRALPCLRPRQAHHCGRQIALALAHIHARGIIHRDVKTDNVLCRFDKGDAQAEERPLCVLADWGAAKKIVEPLTASSHVYARHYRAPELFFGCSTYTTAPDVWAFGCTIGEILLSGSSLLAPPWENDEEPPIEARLDSLEDQQLLGLFHFLGTPAWADVCAMNSHVADDQRRMREWMSTSPRPQLASWRERILRTRPATDEAGARVQEACALLAAIFQWNPVLRLSAAAICEHAFFKGAGS